MKNNISWHISGNYPVREIPQSDFADYSNQTLVHFPRGFETLQIVVLHRGLCEGDCIEAAIEFLQKNHPAALSKNDEEDAFCESQKLSRVYGN